MASVHVRASAAGERAAVFGADAPRRPRARTRPRRGCSRRLRTTRGRSPTGSPTVNAAAGRKRPCTSGRGNVTRERDAARLRVTALEIEIDRALEERVGYVRDHQEKMVQDALADVEEAQRGLLARLDDLPALRDAIVAARETLEWVASFPEQPQTYGFPHVVALGLEEPVRRTMAQARRSPQARSSTFSAKTSPPSAKSSATPPAGSSARTSAQPAPRIDVAGPRQPRPGSVAEAGARTREAAGRVRQRRPDRNRSLRPPPRPVTPRYLQPARRPEFVRRSPAFATAAR